MQGSLQDIINLAQNLDCYWLYPSVKTEEEYGHYLIEELDELELPKKQKTISCMRNMGGTLAINDGGMFTEKGYIYNNRNTFTEWYDGRDVPEEYRVTPQPPQRKAKRQTLTQLWRNGADRRADTESRPVIPLIADLPKNPPKSSKRLPTVWNRVLRNF